MPAASWRQVRSPPWSRDRRRCSRTHAWRAAGARRWRAAASGVGCSCAIRCPCRQKRLPWASLCAHLDRGVAHIQQQPGHRGLRSGVARRRPQLKPRRLRTRRVPGIGTHKEPAGRIDIDRDAGQRCGVLLRAARPHGPAVQTAPGNACASEANPCMSNSLASPLWRPRYDRSDLRAAGKFLQRHHLVERCDRLPIAVRVLRPKPEVDADADDQAAPASTIERQLAQDPPSLRPSRRRSFGPFDCTVARGGKRFRGRQSARKRNRGVDRAPTRQTESQAKTAVRAWRCVPGPAVATAAGGLLRGQHAGSAAPGVRVRTRPKRSVLSTPVRNTVSTSALRRSQRSAGRPGARRGQPAAAQERPLAQTTWKWRSTLFGRRNGDAVATRARTALHCSTAASGLWRLRKPDLPRGDRGSDNPRGMQDSPYDSLDARPWLRRSSQLRVSHASLTSFLIIYASFTPWSGWRDLGVGAFGLPVRAVARARCAFRRDRERARLHAIRHAGRPGLASPTTRRNAILIALAAGTPSQVRSKRYRHSSRAAFRPMSIWPPTICGTTDRCDLGAWRAEALIDRGRLLHLRFAWFEHDSAIPLILLALWPITQNPCGIDALRDGTGPTRHCWTGPMNVDSPGFPHAARVGADRSTAAVRDDRFGDQRTRPGAHAPRAGSQASPRSWAQSSK